MILAKASGRPFGDVLLCYGMERFLARLAGSAVHDQFVLKGALLLRALDPSFGPAQSDEDPHIGSASIKMRTMLECASYFVTPDRYVSSAFA